MCSDGYPDRDVDMLTGGKVGEPKEDERKPIYNVDARESVEKFGTTEFLKGRRWGMVMVAFQ